MRREQTGWARVFGAAMVTAAVGCAGDDGELGQSTEAIALESGALVEPGIAESELIGVPAGVSFSGGSGGWLAVWAGVSWDYRRSVMAARLGPDGALLDRPAFTLTPAPDNLGEFGLGAALGDRWITWNDSDDRLATVPTTGTPVVTRLSAQPCLNLACDAAGCLCASRTASYVFTAQRLDGSGAPSGAAIPLGPSSSSFYATVAIAATATQWLTVFEATHPDTGAIDLRINRVLRDGTPRDGAGVPFTTIAAGRIQPAVATDGTAFLVAFNATVGSGSRMPGIYAHRVEAATGIVAGPPVVLATGSSLSNPSVAWDGARYWVVWQDATSTAEGHPARYVRLGPDGTRLDPTPRLLGASAFRPKVAVSAGRVAMSWQEGNLGAAWFQRFRADGAAESAATPISYHASLWSQPALASDGARFALTCQAGRTAAAGTRAWLIGANGALNSPNGAAYAGYAPLSLFWDGARYRGVVGGATGPLGTATHAVLSADGSTITASPLPALPAFPMGSAYATTAASAALVGGVTFLDTNYTGTPALSRLDATGARLDPLPIAFGGGGSQRVFTTDGTVLLGIWTNSSTSLRAARVSRDGDILDALAWNLSFTPPGGVPLPFTPTAAAYGGGVWTVLGSGGHPGAPTPQYFRLLQVSPAGSVLRSIEFPGATVRGGGATIAWNGQEFVVVAKVFPDGARPLQGALRVWSVRADGAVSPPEGLVLDPAYSVSTAGEGLNLALAALTNGTTAVAWVQNDTRRATRRCVVRMLQPGMGVDAGAPVDAGSDAAIDRPDVAVNDTGAPVDRPDVTVIDAGTADVPVVTVDVPTAPDAAVIPDVLTPDWDVPGDAPLPDDVAVDAGADDASADDAGTSTDVTVDVPSATDAPGPSDRPTAADASVPGDVAATDVPAAADAAAPPPPDDDGGCDVGGVAGARSRSPLFASLSLLALALTARRRDRRASLPR